MSYLTLKNNSDYYDGRGFHFFPINKIETGEKKSTFSPNYKLYKDDIKIIQLFRRFLLRRLCVIYWLSL